MCAGTGLPWQSPATALSCAQAAFSQDPFNQPPTSSLPAGIQQDLSVVVMSFGSAERAGLYYFLAV